MSGDGAGERYWPTLQAYEALGTEPPVEVVEHCKRMGDIDDDN
jgi:hypothetical protein